MDHEYSDLTYAICEVFEDFLDKRNITIDNLDRQEYVQENGEEDTARIFGNDWDELCSGVESILKLCFMDMEFETDEN